MTALLGSWADRRRNRKKGEMGRSSGARAYVKIEERRASRVARDTLLSIYLSYVKSKPDMASQRGPRGRLAEAGHT